MTERYELTEEDRQLILCALGELAAARNDFLVRAAQAAYRLKGKPQFDEYHKIARRQWISVPAEVTSDVESIRLVPPHLGTVYSPGPQLKIDP